MRRTLVVITALAALALSLVVGSSPAEAAPTITPWKTSAAVGGRLSASANGCAPSGEETDTGFTAQRPALVLVTGTGADARMAAYGAPTDTVRVRFTLPGWIDPDQPASVVGSCTRVTYDFETNVETTEVLFTYPAVAIDVVPGTPEATGPLISLSRTTAAGGQAIHVEVSGCEGADEASVTLLTGSDLTLQTPFEYVTGASEEVLADGSAALDVVLNRPTVDEGGAGGGPVPEGDLTLVGTCDTFDGPTDDYTTLFSAPALVTVVGTNPSGSILVEVADDDSSITVSGEGCTGGREVHLVVEGQGIGGPIELAERQARAIAERDLSAAARLSTPDASADAVDAAVVPEADGSWSTTAGVPANVSYLMVTASCGDPLDDGFTYVRRSLLLREPTFYGIYVDRVSPTSSPVGGAVTAQVYGECEGEATVAILDEQGEVVTESAPITGLSDTVPTPAHLTAPNAAGSYGLVASCDDDSSEGSGQTYEVFTPTMRSGTAPLAVEATSGWPEQGTREVYEGRIGPIDLPAMDMGEEPMTSSQALPPSGLFIDIPRPDGDFAITKIDMNLVDADGMPVPATAAHLHHFVFGAANGENPACPESTFGIPGSIIGAAGAEKTALQLGDPYGILVDSDDVWKGVYDLMSRSMEDQTVFLTYDITYRRDVQNVRPVSRYFGSATGCGSFTWTIDGSGTPDTQSTYIDIQKSGRLVGGGAHIHNGGMHADIVNDRGRRLCRSEIDYGTEPVGHEMATGIRAMDEPTTTIVDDEEPMDEYPPEFYDDDLAIDGISNCALAEKVTAGERIRFDAVYENERPRSGVMGIYSLFVWEGGGPAEPGPTDVEPPPANAVPGTPNYAG